MKPTLEISCAVILPFLSVLYSEKCILVENTSQKRIEEGEVLGIDCFQHTDSSTYWYRNGSKTPITKQNSSRIHQQDTALWFLPVTYHDSGSYECITQDSTKCYKKNIQIEVFNHSGSLCFNENHFFEQRIPVATNEKIVCNYKDHLLGQEPDDLSIDWFKECNPVRGERFSTSESELIINNINKDDMGKYQCRGSYTYLRHKYNFSRSIRVSDLKIQRKRTEILHPRNHTIEAELGSKILIECNVSHSKNNLYSISWMVNNTLVDLLFKGRIEEGFQKDNDIEGGQLSVVPLTIKKLQNEDYGQLFVCRAGQIAAYISIHRPTRNLTGLAALVLLILIPVIICLLFKTEIVLWYRKLCRPFFHKRVLDGKVYDAYVLYPKTDTQDCFALKVLPEVLEKQCGYNLFIPGRDDLPGKALVNVVDETIRQSRRLIIILLPELPSLDKAAEQHIAVYRALVPDGIKVILIEMAKIKDYSHMPESIRYIKQKQGAIRWKGDLTKRSSYSANNKFWKRVRYRMPPEHQNSPELPLVSITFSDREPART
nr:interleukin-1 receptor-like 2 isoform X1 [Anolis sagrei ordinatus]XP_060625722.1 interleukin-1 receptor-like 2 isoform X1 [Anolis sagrei ordinatus]XP_060625724.1 interleukin-1 receptor-like 2 isoform X1 [Anolis sagrei ordinatus]XP_060625725.1 interleukin-1 receptor-like 2 isoform X1 [Anolis sagrei ordinatus]XP_060625726.1 interleukin-1 receptor-like 2 isoform X1 [Anolis sagrei ordinatus]